MRLETGNEITPRRANVVKMEEYFLYFQRNKIEILIREKQIFKNLITQKYTI